MKTPTAALMAVALATCAGTTAARAQLDYRNLDDHRPVRTEDAYVIERYAFEFMLPTEYETADGSGQLVVAPELAYGAILNGQFGVKLPIASGEGGDDGLAGPRLFGLYSINTEGRSLPGFAVRADVTIPWGAAAGDRTLVFLKAMATRGWGRTRAHLNLGATLQRLDADRPVDAEPQWMATLAVDRTLLRRSLLLIGEVVVLEEARGTPTAVTVSAGARLQLTPTLVLDGGIGRRLTSSAGPDLAVTVGLTHAFGIASLMPGRAP
jgi:hypothetical protein